MKFKAFTNDQRKLDVNWDHVSLYVSKWKPHTPLVVEITRRQAKKSDPMRRYYFAVVIPKFMKHEGYEPSEELFFHHQLKITYFEYHKDYLDKDGKPTIKQDKHGIWRNVPSVFGNDSDMDISVKQEFVEWVKRKAGESGVYIPDPNE